MNKSFLIFLFTVSLVGIFFFGCAKETPRTDVTLELTSPDTIEALVEKDLNTIGTSYQDIDSFPESTPAQVTYVDSVEMQKPLRVQNDDSLYKGEESIDDSVITTSNVSLWGPDTDKTLEPLSPRETVSVVPPPSGDVTLLGEAGSSTQLSPVGTEAVSTPQSSSFLQPKPATETSVVTAPNSGYVYQGNQSSSGRYVGQTAVTSGNAYTVQAGDNLIKIARKFGVKVNDLCEVNGISRSQILKVGQVLQIPGEKSASAPAETVQPKEVNASISSVVQPASTQTTTTAAPASGTQNYTVQAGDSYWKLARRFNSSVEELMSMNGTSSDKLKIGQVIVVPNR